MIVTLVANGFLDENWRDGLAVAGVAVTVIGFVLALGAIVIAGSAAKGAERAARAARSEIRKSVRVGQLRWANRLAIEIQGLLLSKRWEVAVIRLADLRQELVEIRGIVGGAHRDECTRKIAVISSVEGAVVKQHSGRGRFDPVFGYERLADVCDFLSGLAIVEELKTEGEGDEPS